MKKLILATALIAASGLGVAAAQNATDVSAAAPAVQTNGSNTNATNTGARQVPAPGSRNCIRDTGSHIPPPKGGCLPVAGTSYSYEDLQRTGQPDIGRALQQLDPSVTVHGH
ncbi:MAG: hypothetical protein ACTHMO_01785 [Rhodanobacteraceae bacterium]